MEKGKRDAPVFYCNSEFRMLAKILGTHRLIALNIVKFVLFTMLFTIRELL